MYDKGIADRKVVDVLADETKTTSIIRYYNEPDLRDFLEPLSFDKKWNVLEEVGNNISYFNRFKQDSDLLEGWIRYRYEPNFNTAFSNLSNNEAELFRFLQKYGGMPDEAFKNLKLSYEKITVENKFKQLLDFPDATQDIAYFNKRRAEMLPPDFIDSRRKNMLNIEEVDGAIDLELSYNLDLVPSLKHQAGDFIHIVTGRSYDHMGIPFDFPLKVANSNNPNVFYTNWLGYYDIISKEGKGYLNSIAEHFEKISNPKDGLPSLNTVVINYKHFEELSTSFGKPSNHLKNLTDQFLQQNFASYISTNKLIKLNY